jgi:hypothetical protein
MSITSSSCFYGKPMSMRETAENRRHSRSGRGLPTFAARNRRKPMKHMRTIAIAVLIAVTLGMTQAEPRHRNRNYILRRQEAGQVSGTPTSRLIIGKREIDIYRNGLMFEGDNVVGVRPRR